MRFLIPALLTSFLALSNLSAWLIVEPIDYSKLMSDSSFSAIVKVEEVRDTGSSKELFKDGVKYREVNLRLKILSTLKGKRIKELKLSIYRIPTMKELKADGVKKEDIRLKHLNLATSEIVHEYFASAQKGDHLLIYLKGDSKSGFLPVTGNEKPSHSIFVLETSNTIRSANLLKRHFDSTSQATTPNNKGEQSSTHQSTTAPQSNFPWQFYPSIPSQRATVAMRLVRSGALL